MKLVNRLMLVGVCAMGMTLMACGDSGTSKGGTKDTDTTSDTTDTGTDDTTDTGDETTDTTDTGDDTPDPTDTGDDTTDTTDTGLACDYPTEFADYGSHVYSIAIVEDPGGYGCDSNGDGKVDKDDGLLNDALVGPASLLKLAGQDINGTFAASVEDGSLIFLAELAGYDGTDTEDATVSMYVGSDIEGQPDPECGIFENADANCDWYIGESSFDDNCETLVSVPGASVKGGELSAGPSPFTFTFDIAGVALPLEVQQGKILGTISGKFDIADGRICGVVPQEALIGALDAACPGTPEDPELCQYKDLVPLAITCKECSVVLELDAAEVKSLALEPVE